jgi:hypothetical protein
LATPALVRRGGISAAKSIANALVAQSGIEAVCAGLIAEGLMLRFLLISMAGFSAVALASADSISKVNGGIRIERAERRRPLDRQWVNRGRRGRTRSGVETVNGSVQLQPRVVAESVETVNGSVRRCRGPGARVGRDRQQGASR